MPLAWDALFVALGTRACRAPHVHARDMWLCAATRMIDDRGGASGAATFIVCCMDRGKGDGGVHVAVCCCPICTPMGRGVVASGWVAIHIR